MKDQYYKPNINDGVFIQKLKHHIENKIPMSFTRFGDGEIYFITDNVPTKIEQILRDTWGYSDLIRAKNDTLSIINKGLSYSTVIGLMNPNNDIAKLINYREDIWSIKRDYLDSIRSRKLLIADHMITRGPILGDVNEFKKIIKGNDIAIVSPRVDELKTSDLEKYLNVNIRYVKTPMGIDLNDRSSIFKKLDEIDELIVLYGCSLTGKDFGVYLEGRGKIALDFGATLDAWGGMISRKWFNNIQKHCLIKK